MSDQNLSEKDKKVIDIYVIKLIEHLITTLSLAINKAHLFSKWLLFGSILSIYSIISSIDQYKTFYSPWYIKAFLILHLLSILSSLIYLFTFEIFDQLRQSKKDFFENNEKIVMNYLKLLYVAEEYDRKIINEVMLSDDSITNSLTRFFDDIKNKKYVFMQVLLFTLAYTLLIIQIFKKI